MFNRVGVFLLTLFSSIFLFAILVFGVALISSGTAVGIGLGIGALIIMLLIAVMMIWEISFGFNSAKLESLASAQGINWQLDKNQLTQLKLKFPQNSWQYHYLVAIECESERNRKGAREAVRSALALLKYNDAN